MKIASLSDAKDQLSRYVDHVRRGGRVRILVRGVAVADLVPVARADEDRPGAAPELPDLERRGLIHRGRGGIPAEILRPGPRPRGKPLSEVLLDQRRRGR